MAIYHLSAQIISRSSGRSATAAAAYRAGCEIADERTNETHDYSRKRHVDHVEIIAPAYAPRWTLDRAALWNNVEHSEKRKDAQLAREINVALPRELMRSQMIELMREFVTAEFVNRGMIADIALHHLDDNNPHAHIMLTTREISADGFGNKNRAWNDKALLQNWREKWSEFANKSLERAGHNVQIDHRTLEAQRIDRAPAIHMGPAVTAMERRGIKTSHQDRAAAVVAAALAKASASISIELEIKRAEQEHRSPAPSPVPAQAQAQAQDLILYRVHKLERELQQARTESDQARDELKSITLQAPRHAAAPPRSREQIKLCVKIKIDSESMTLEQARRERDRSHAVFDEQEKKWNSQGVIKRGIGVGKSDLFEAAQKLDAASSVVDLIERTLDQSPRVREHIDKLVIDERQRYESERETWQQYEREKRRFTAVSSDVESAEKRAQDALHALHEHIKSLETSDKQRVLKSLDASTSEILLQHQRQRSRGHEMSM